MERHTVEAADSWETFRARYGLSSDNDQEHRGLKHHHQNYEDEPGIDLVRMEQDQEDAYLEKQDAKKEKKLRKADRKHRKHMKRMYADPGIRHSTVHGMMIDAGSTGSRLHLFEWEPRILSDHKEVQEAVSGRKLSFPASESRWTDRLRPGIATFASLPDDELVEGIAEYLSPLIEFAQTILREKEESFESFPIFLRATAGMRTLDRKDRFRVLSAVKTLFSNNTFCPFYFESEFARILSGEEEAIFGWTGINFAMGNLVEESEGAGTVVNPQLTYGALDMGGASTQISFYEPNEDIMSNLFKLQIGQGKHWNLYAHSFLYFGLNEARNRFQAHLLAGKDANSRLVQGVHNPCLPGGSRQEVRLNIHINSHGEETWKSGSGVSENGYYEAVLNNNNTSGDFDECMAYAKEMLNLEKNTWCDFAHKGECSFNGVAMPELPIQSEHFGEFLAFSNYYHVWDFLGLPKRASLQELYDATENICAMSKDEIFAFNQQNGKADVDQVEDFCFRSAYAFNMLRNGYGFDMDEYITATNVLNGQKVGWALGAMLYEINTFPWEYVDSKQTTDSISQGSHSPLYSAFFGVILFGIAVSLASTFFFRRKRNRSLYQPLKEAHSDA
jgi:Golgi nucleoside diphosphatase